ncbi:MAG: hypothetical protein ACPGXL_00665 [Chitinophagales bacterium]
MQHIIRTIVFSSLFFLLAQTNTNAQINRLNSPYSRLGVGDLFASEFSVNRALGSASTAYRTPLNINFNNPASYSSLAFATLEMSVASNTHFMNNGNTTQRTGTAYPGYFALGFPVVKQKWGSSIGLIPYSSLNYDLTDVRYTDGTTVNDVFFPSAGQINYRFLGAGNLYQLYWGNGFKFKGLSAGVNIGWLFGTQTSEVRSNFIDFADALSNRNLEELVVGDFMWSVGTQYTHKMKDDFSLTVGATIKPLQEINATKDQRWERINIGSNSDEFTTTDTVLSVISDEGILQLPSELSLGIMAQQSGSWLLAADVKFQNWSEFQNFGVPDANLTNAMQFGLGFELIPDSKSITDFWKVANYRIGAYYNTGRMIFQDTQLSEYAVSLGLGLPIRKVDSRLNLSLEIGQRGSIENNLIRETFINTTFGFTLNDRAWFFKRVFD